jgi:RHS repeat-associated protein
MGRIENSSQVVGSTPYPFSYTYDISGALATETYPSGRVVTNAFDAAGRISGVTGSIAPSAYASNVTYAPQGPISGLNLGSGMTEAWTFNSREQPITLKVTTTGLPLNLGWGYGAAANNNGNVQSQTISGPGLGGLTLTQNYTYDAVNRLWTFAETGSTGSQTYNTNQNYNYDAFGNRWLTSSWIAPGMSGQTPISDAFVNNQWGLTGVNGYDGAGNQTSIAGAYRTFSYDGENRQIMAVIGNPSTATTYNYDGEGRRVQKITTSGTTNYIYDAMGHLAAEYGGSSTSAGRVYLSVDALGSTRLVTDASGNPTEQYDYAPFGEELTQGIDGRVALYSTNQYPTTPDAVTEKFTSKERDAESGLDYFGARYFSGAQGRFTSPDPLPWIHWQHGNRDDQQDSQHTLQIRKTSTCMRT